MTRLDNNDGPTACEVTPWLDEGDVRLYLGDCLDLMAELPESSVDMVLCDLPYGTTQNAWDSVIDLDRLWQAYDRVCKPHAAIVLTAQTPFDKVLGASRLERLRYEWIWAKTIGTGHLNANRAPMKAHENALVFYRKQPTYNPERRPGDPYGKVVSGSDSSNYGKQSHTVTENNGGRYPISIIEFSRDPEQLHPTQKPVALFGYLIRTYTNPGDLVLDNCIGSGTTAVAARRNERRCIGIDMNEDYLRIAAQRLAQQSLLGGEAA